MIVYGAWAILALRAGGSAYNPNSFGIGSVPGHQEHRRPSTRVPTEAVAGFDPEAVFKIEQTEPLTALTLLSPSSIATRSATLRSMHAGAAGSR
jgi:hypothetical protein